MNLEKIDETEPSLRSMKVHLVRTSIFENTREQASRQIKAA